MRSCMFHKIICLVLMMSLTISLCTPSVASGSIDYFENFDNGKINGLDIVPADEDDSFGVLVTENGELKSWVTQTRPIKMTHTFPEVIKDGMFYVAFDYMSTKGFNDSYLRMMSGDSQFQICGFRNTGLFGHFKNFSVWALEDTAVEYSADIWYSVGVLFDIQSRYAYFYFGEQGTELSMIEKMALPDGFADITDMMLVHSYGDYTPAMWDNIRVNEINTSSLDLVEKRENITFPDEIYREYLNQICYENFEDDSLGVTISGWAESDTSNGMMRVLDGEEYVAKTWVDSKYPKRITYSFDKPIKDGMYYAAFDWKTESSVNDSFVRLISGDSQYQICGFRNDGFFGKFVDFSKWALDSVSAAEYSSDIWYTIGILLDMDLKKI